MKVPSSLAIAAAFAASSVAALDAKFYGIIYDIHPSEFECKDFDTMTEDLKILKGVTNNIRVYSTYFECITTLLEVARKSDIKVWLGMWSDVETSIVHDGSEHKVVDRFPLDMADFKELVEDTEWIQNENILGIQVSSDALRRYYVEGPGSTTGSSDRRGIDTVLRHLKTVRSYLGDHNLTFPVVISDTMDMYSRFPELYEAVDLVAVTEHAYWDEISPEDAAHYIFKQFQEHQTRAKRVGKLIQLFETGWSSGGNMSDTVASPLAQGVFTQDFLTLASRQNLNAFFYAAFDLTYRTDDLESHCGIHYVNRTMKPDMKAVHVGAPLQAVRLWAGDNVIKAHRYWNTNDSVNENFARVYAAKPSAGPSGVWDDEIWLWNDENLYSKSSNLCLESFGEGNTQALRMRQCSKDNRDQKWIVANGNLASQNDANFCVRVDVDPTTPDGNLVVDMSPCNEQRKHPISKFPVAREPLEIGIKTDGGVLTELSGKVTWQTTRQSNAENHQWLYDPVAQNIKSASNNFCLDASKGMDGEHVALADCAPANENQKWDVNDITGQIHHATHIGFCLGAPDEVDEIVYLAWCDKDNANQQWNVKLVNAKA
ncbi:hypothetical protein B5M09_008812 [Aphanomyces astaci]|uniref:glucan endo-1,3-beta-D-glucosidase n=1 Tax=Aphanomyces astaci TaxID=112090 RepID=A0A3R7WZC9_APHAT|nr:hypothetical protein B5M09_008812 [Aphanomyces astaci]